MTFYTTNALNSRDFYPGLGERELSVQVKHADIFILWQAILLFIMQNRYLILNYIRYLIYYIIYKISDILYEISYINKISYILYQISYILY